MRKKNPNTIGCAKTQVTTPSIIKISVDVHASFYVYVRQLDDGRIEKPQRIHPDAFLGYALKQKDLASTKVHVCYEAGPTGFHMARELIEQGIDCIVVRPGRLDAYGNKVNNDKTDALALAERFDRHIAGNQRALVKVRIPTREEETRRCYGRQRQQLVSKRQAFASMGRGQALLHNRRMLGNWWLENAWNEHKEHLPETVVKLLENLRGIIMDISKLLEELEKDLCAAGRKNGFPKGVGAATMEKIDQEVCNWDRFKKRKAPGSYAGLTGGVAASGHKRMDLSITKAGNRRLRTYLIEAAWRLKRHQPDCPLIQRFAEDLNQNSPRRKKAIVAVARILFTDLWRWRTGRRKLEDMGYQLGK